MPTCRHEAHVTSARAEQTQFRFPPLLQPSRWSPICPRAPVSPSSGQIMRSREVSPACPPSRSVLIAHHLNNTQIRSGKNGPAEIAHAPITDKSAGQRLRAGPCCFAGPWYTLRYSSISTAAARAYHPLALWHKCIA
ncbi:hypothetical protein FA95DRAFT_782813 [Auriscalpium vulgare]|uniref:Uncharacterized protein n=1 Tax=Auriscalpium vulgare TaxID=40419 RepID=A0ACB8RAE1_9AGAM|nr:hypothetical protein FA95DRAFT_782813 [Auriscalpium vulgare]